jgi:hypothetical protein
MVSKIDDMNLNGIVIRCALVRALARAASDQATTASGYDGNGITSGLE